MLYFGLGMGGLLFLIGWATYYFAPRVGPNPIFGVRVGYAFANREVWDKTNRFGGALIALVGIVTAGVGVTLQLLSIAPSQGMSVLTVAMIAALLGATVWMFVYARGLAQGAPITREITPVKFRWAYLAPVLISFGLLVALMVYFYPQLPAARMATHFGFDDRPNGWMPRDTFVVSYLGLAALFVVINLVVVLVATREPMIAFGRWGSRWLLTPERGLIFAGLAFALTNIIFMIALWATAWYNIYGVHAFPLSLFLWMLVPFLALIVGLFFLLGRRTT